MAEERVQRRLAAILAADVVGYSRLMETDEEGTRSKFNDCLETVVRPALEQHDGRLVKTMGDGFLVELPSVMGAVQAAVDIQSVWSQRQQDEPQDRRLELRVGIHSGDVIVEGDDIHGDGVNIAARLEGLAEPNGICVSDVVHTGIRKKLTIEFEDLGEQSLKNIAEPVQVFRAVLETPNQKSTQTDDALFRRPAVAVLPFKNLSGDPDQDFFADGLTEDIITALSLWRSFPVIARNSTFAYKGQSPDIRMVGEELGARYVVEGSVRKSGDRVRVTAQLINAETGHHVWAERYDREIEDIFALQDEIADHIAGIVEPTVARSERERIVSKAPSDLAAWEYCLRGYAAIYDASKETNLSARKMFERAIALDPRFSRAHTGLAFTYARDLRFFEPEDRDQWMRLMFEAARRAVTLDESDADARCMLARAYNHAGQPDAAVAEARRAVELNPHNADANNILGAALSIRSARYADGIPWFERALRLNPLDPQRYVYETQLAIAHLGAGHFEKAVIHAEDAIRRQPNFSEARVALASALGFMGLTQDAGEAINGLEMQAAALVEQHPIYGNVLKACILNGLRKAGLAE